jgi:bromodomain adjacent to zinc finger domain protein 1A
VKDGLLSESISWWLPGVCADKTLLSSPAAASSWQALAADVALACDLWRDAFNVFDMSHEEGFRSADGRLADAVEEQMQQLMQEVQAGSSLAAAVGLPVAAAGAATNSLAAAAVVAAEDVNGIKPAADEQQQPQQQQQQEVQQQQTAADPGAVAVKAEATSEPHSMGGATAAAAAAADPTGDGMDVDTPCKEEQQQQQQQQQRPEELMQVSQSVEGAEHAVKMQQGEQNPSELAAAVGGVQAESAAAAGQPHSDVTCISHSHGNSPTPDAAPADPHGLTNASRPFNPLAGCRVCWRDDDNARLLLCDGCEDEYHCYCVTPSLLEVPEGDWFCPVCRPEGAEGGLPDEPGRQGQDERSSAAAAAAAALGNVSVSSGSSSIDWDMAASAQLPVVAQGSVTPAWSRPGMQYIRELVGTAQRLSAVPYGSWPPAARLQLLALLCELLAVSNAGRKYVEERMEAKREAKRKVAEARAKINKAKKEAADAAKAAAKEARAAKKATVAGSTTGAEAAGSGGGGAAAAAAGTFAAKESAAAAGGGGGDAGEQLLVPMRCLSMMLWLLLHACNVAGSMPMYVCCQLHRHCLLLSV